MAMEQMKIPKIAIVGMDCFLGGCDGLDAFERTIYQGTQHFIPVPPQRWQMQSDIAPAGAYIQDFEIDALRFQTLLQDIDKLNSHDLLMLKVANNALKDAGLSKKSRVAVVITTATQLSINQLQKTEQLTVEASEYPTYTENILASRISTLWNFPGSSFTLAAEQNSALKALEIAQKLLISKEVDAVVVGAVELAGNRAGVLLRNQVAKVNTGVNTLSYDENANGWMIGEGAAAVVLKLHQTAKQHKNRIYAVIDALSVGAAVSNPQSEIIKHCQQAFQLADIKPTDIGYLEVFASGIQQQDESEIQALTQAYQTSEANLTCVIASAKANVGHTYAASGLVSLVKTALCLYHRYIPAVPQWSKPKMPELWQGSPFYVATESKPWFLEKGATRRIAAVNSIEVDGSYGHIILSEESNQGQRSSRYLEQMPLYLFAIAADSQSTLLNQIRVLEETIRDCSCLSAAASQTFTDFQKHQNATYTLAILGRNKDEVLREIQRSLKGVADAFNTGKDWQTPAGSYFTANPLGERGNIAFVYPGAYGSYVGLARHLFRLFPKIYDDPVIKNVYNRVANIEKLLYPRSLEKFSNRQLEALEQLLLDDPVTMLESEVGFAGLMTAILRNYFQLQPKYAFGYSLGETSMMISHGIWSSFQGSSDNLNSSALFKTRLSGSKNAVREYWKLPQQNDEDIWSTHVLLCPVDSVKEVVKHEQRVYIPLINTPEEVAIAGDVKACQRVIEKLNCDAFRAPFNHVIHCEAMHSEYDELVKIHTLPLENTPKTIFYSAAEYQPITLESRLIGYNIAQVLCQQLDFPRLVNRVWEDGARVFIEVGPGGNCSRWINQILKQKEHTTVSLNKRGVDDHASIIKALAKLLSHKVKMDLSSLYSHSVANHNQTMVRNVTIGTSTDNSTFLNDNKHQIFPETSSKNSWEFQEMKYPWLASTKTTDNNLINNFLRNPQYQKLSENTLHTSKIHAEFLNARQDSLEQISEIIKLQLTCYHQMFEE
jgi:PfaB family protein